MTQDEIIEMPEYLNAAYEGDDLYTGDQVRELMKLVAEKERDACADMIEDLENIDWNIWDCAKAIRERGDEA